MDRQWTNAAAYLTIFLMPALLLLGAVVHRPWLAFGIVILVFPLARAIFGALPPSGSPEWREDIATFLERLPLAYVGVLPIAVFSSLVVVDATAIDDTPAMVGFGLSLWMTLLFGTCVAHELIHRRDKHQAVLGYMLAGFCGYPALGMEHLAHHARPGDTSLAEYPLKAESVWRFAGRRIRRIGAEMFAPGAPVWGLRFQMPNVVRTRAALLVTTLTLAAFATIGGQAFAFMYLVMMVAVAFGVQLITYIQHWGLGDDSIPDRISFGRGWEEDCRFQAWVTLSISLHDQHHQDSRRPYYRAELAPDSPRLPAGYVLLMFASMVPGVWRRIMEPAHLHWLSTPANPLSAGRRLTCFGHRGLRATAAP